ncbi:MAG: ABC transporter ATP-binding protein [Eubacterium sp.]|nr:ABC transporter ATP-binding protein [Eubacterium sp.]
MIQTQNLTKIYKNGFKAVDGLNLHVEEGDIFGFLGPNGAGKTTTIRMLDGLHEPTGGIARIAGMDITKNAIPIRKIIGVVPESHGYYYSMTAREYLEYFSVLFNEGKDNREYVEYLLKKVGLLDKQHVAIGKFSRGMKQRLGIAKSLVNHPKIVFLDEPTLGLDPRGQQEIQQLLLEINRTEKITIFITSHQLKDIEVMCNKVCIVKDGVMVEQGSIGELQKKYLAHYTMYLDTSDNEMVGHMIARMDTTRSVKELADGRLEVKLKKELSASEVQAVRYQILHQIFDAGFEIEEMSHKVLSMEDIFFRATGTGKENRYE